jgi:translation initiation factor 3 subunit E
LQVISQESYEYRDPVTDFLRCLYAEADFEGAQAALSGCEAVLRRDFFLVGAAEPFMASARAALFETYCRVHRAVSLHSLSEQLGMADEDAEKWVVDLVRGARLSAKVDAAAGAVVMQAQGASAYEGLLDKARGLSLRTFALANTVVGMLRT